VGEDCRSPGARGGIRARIPIRSLGRSSDWKAAVGPLGGGGGTHALYRKGKTILKCPMHILSEWVDDKREASRGQKGAM